jgi:hypothetical protein
VDKNCIFRHIFDEFEYFYLVEVTCAIIKNNVTKEKITNDFTHEIKNA